ncbi:MAG: indole-3-glycerol phosphate synthase TrpC [Candidatus Peribacteraceae bacterium]|nr:indole-3-glycerol phosphate synthase TrpC [Candidatus Peribacteraceae bacterium]
MTILDQIVGTKKKEIAQMAKSLPPRTKSRRSFLEALRASHPAFIAEVKPKSPSEGVLISMDRIPELVEAYDRSATAISVLCDETYFGGGYDLLSQVASLTDKPLLAKEFIIDEKQIAMAASHGASAVLLIAAILDEKELATLVDAAICANCDVLLELHDSDDLEKAIRVLSVLGEHEKSRVIIGINNRNLDSLTVDIAQTEQLAPLARELLGKDHLIISESGLDSAEACLRLRPFVDGFLIGTSILRSPDPKAFLSSLISACNRT